MPYNRSSPHRYFTGQAPIPRNAVAAVVRVCGGDVATPMAMSDAAQLKPA